MIYIKKKKEKAIAVNFIATPKKKKKKKNTRGKKDSQIILRLEKVRVASFKFISSPGGLKISAITLS